MKSCKIAYYTLSKLYEVNKNLNINIEIFEILKYTIPCIVGITDVQPNKWYTELTVALQVSTFDTTFFYCGVFLPQPDVAEFSLLCINLNFYLSQKNNPQYFHVGKRYILLLVNLTYISVFFYSCIVEDAKKMVYKIIVIKMFIL